MDTQVATLEQEYSRLMLGVSDQFRAEVEAPGPLSEDDSVRLRQKVYRELLHAQFGVLLPETPGGIMHHPV